jgi:hypothetical protein
MPFRVRPDGSVECDTLEEAFRVRDELLNRRTREAKRAARAAVGTVDLHGNGTGALIAALKGAPTGIESPDLAGALGVTPRSIPPLILGLRRKVRALGMDLDDLLIRETTYAKGRPVSKYRLTEEGIKKLTGGT